MRRSRGVSLIEALVALAAMGFGLLGVVGLQSTMRFNSDIAKQRSEAVRIAQETIEARRSFSALNTTIGQVAYADIASSGPIAVAGIASNTTFTRTETVQGTNGARTRTLVVDVTWNDRTGQQQAVRLTTAISGVTPELSATLGLPAFGSPTRLPGGRNAAIPRSAVDQGDGTSLFSPPGTSHLGWIFDNVSGFINKICVFGVCSTANARLLAGFVSFATTSTQPTPALSEAPPSGSFNLDVEVARTYPTSSTVSCFEERESQFVAYFCAVPVDSLSGNKWSGRSLLSFGNISSSTADTANSRYKVCRYTPVRNSHPVVPTISNTDHPLDYMDVTQSLINQNFLVIRAGDGTTAFVCPDDDTGTPDINGNTWHHQPST